MKKVVGIVVNCLGAFVGYLIGAWIFNLMIVITLIDAVTLRKVKILNSAYGWLRERFEGVAGYLSETLQRTFAK